MQVERTEPEFKPLTAGSGWTLGVGIQTESNGRSHVWQTELIVGLKTCLSPENRVSGCSVNSTRVRCWRVSQLGQSSQI